MKIRFSLCLLFLALSLQLTAQERVGADVLFEEGKYQEAADVCLAELQESSKNMNAYCYLVWSMQALRKHQDAYKYALEGMNVARYDRRMILAAGESLYYLGRNREALKYLEEYIVYVTSTFRKDDVHYFMGEIYIRLGEFNNADIAFSTAVYYNSKNANWWARLGYAREMAKDYAWASDAYDKALQLNATLSEARLGKERVVKLIAR